MHLTKTRHAALAPAARVSPELYEHWLPVTDGGYSAAYFLSFVGVQSKALKINCKALQRIDLCPQQLHKSLKWCFFMDGNKAVVPGRGGNCLKRSGGGWRKRWNIIWPLPHLPRQDDAEDGHCSSLLLIRQIRLWGTIIQSLGCS